MRIIVFVIVLHLVCGIFLKPSPAIAEKYSLIQRLQPMTNTELSQVRGKFILSPSQEKPVLGLFNYIFSELSKQTKLFPCVSFFDSPNTTTSNTSQQNQQPVLGSSNPETNLDTIRLQSLMSERDLAFDNSQNFIDNIKESQNSIIQNLR